MAATTFAETYKGYENTLNSLKEQCAQAEKNAIVAETNLTSLQEQRKKLIEECEKFTGMPIEQVPDVLDKKKAELEDIMNKLGSIDIEGEITKDTLEHINDIVKEYNIAGQEE